MNSCSPGTSPVVLIISCAADMTNGRNACVRQTWLKEWGTLVPHRFLYGEINHTPAHDELICGVPDSYAGIWQKQHAGYQWALQKGHSHVFICCTDTYVHVPRLLACGYGQCDYLGVRCAGEIYGSGGAGYWLSGNAIRAMADAGTRDLPGCNGWPDAVDGHLLASLGIALSDDRRFHGHRPDPLPGDLISVHLGKGTGNFDPEEMFEVHRCLTT